MPIESADDRLVFLSDFGTEATYTARDASQATLKGIFDDPFLSVGMADGPATSDAKPTFLCRTADLPATALGGDAGDFLELSDGTTFAVVDLQPDGVGTTLLTLAAASDAAPPPADDDEEHEIDGTELIRLTTVNPVGTERATVSSLFDWFTSNVVEFSGAVSFSAAVSFPAGSIAVSSISGLAAVATSGAYSDLSGKPTLGTLSALNTGDLAAVAYTGAYADLSGKPSLAAIATSGSASDLSAGTIASARVAGSYTGITGVGTLAAGSIPTSLLTGNVAAASVTGLAAIATSGSASDLSTGTLPSGRIDLTAAYAFSGLAATTINQVDANATNLTVAAATQTANTTANPTINVTRTNAVGAGNSAPPILQVSCTNTSGSTNNKVFDFLVGGVTQLNLQVGGTLVGAGDYLCAGSVQVGPAQRFQWNGRAVLTSASAASVETAAFPTVGNATAIPAGGTAGSGYKLSSTSNFGIFFGSGAPTLSAAKGSLYLRSDGTTTNDRAYINSNGSTTWTALTTAA